MKICFLVDINSIHARRWVKDSVEKGHEVHVITPEGPLLEGANVYFWTLEKPKNFFLKLVSYLTGFVYYWRISLGQRLVLKNIPFLLNPITLSRVVRMGFSSNVNLISNKIIEIKPDIVHIQYLNHLESMFAVLDDKYSSPLVVSVWGDDIQEQKYKHPPLLKEIRKKVLKKASVVTSPSTFLGNLTLEYINESIKLKIVPFGVDLEMFKNFNKKRVNKVGFIKYFLPGYGAEHFIKAIKSIVLEVPDATFLMAGSGNQGYYREIAKKEKVEDKIEFLGSIDYKDMPRYFNLLSVYVMPSDFESFGVSAVEAQACGVPVVASKLGGIPEVVIDGKSGILVDPKNPLEIASAVTKVLKGDLSSFSKEARANAVNNFSWGSSTKKMEQIYKELVENK